MVPAILRQASHSNRVRKLRAIWATRSAIITSRTVTTISSSSLATTSTDMSELFGITIFGVLIGAILLDLAYVGLIVGFFLLALAYLAGCGALKKKRSCYEH